MHALDAFDVCPVDVHVRELDEVRVYNSQLFICLFDCVHVLYTCVIHSGLPAPVVVI